MWALLTAIVVVGILFAFVRSARQQLLAKAEPVPPACHGCAPCHHHCHREEAR